MGLVPTPKVFISYSHDSDAHCERVLDLADRLRGDGIDAEIDQYEPAPAEGWPAWCERQIEAADFVLMVCTETYNRRVQGDEGPGKGLGVVYEVRIIRQEIYDSGAVSKKFIPVLFSDGLSEHIPKPVKAWTRYVVDTEEGYKDLYRRLTGQPRTVRPVLGGILDLPPRKPARTADPALMPHCRTSSDDLSEVWDSRRPHAPLIGRSASMATLLGALRSEQRQVIGLIGPGGVGKSALLAAAIFAQREIRGFEKLYQFELENEYDIDYVVEHSITHFCSEWVERIPVGTARRREALIKVMRQRPCLLLLENLERVAGETRRSDTGNDYVALLQAMATERTPSCILYSSRSSILKPAPSFPSFGAVEIELMPLSAENTRQLVESILPGASGTPEEWLQVWEIYRGLPLWLLVAAGELASSGSSAVADLLRGNPPISNLFDRAVKRLGGDERLVLLLLAAARRPLDLLQIESKLGSRAASMDLSKIASILTSSFLVEKRLKSGLALQPVMSEHATATLQSKIIDELEAGKLDLVDKIPLIDTEAPELSITAQRTAVLAPLIAKWYSRGNSAQELRALLKARLNALRAEPPKETMGYAAGNVINILGVLSEGDLDGLDLSQLVIRSAYLRDVTLRRGKLEDSKLVAAMLGNTFGSIWHVGFSPCDRHFAASSVSGEVITWDAETGAPGRRYGRHRGWSFAFAFDSHGCYVASAGGDRQVLRWETDIAGEPVVFAGHKSRVRSVAFHPEQGWLASASEDKTVLRWLTVFGAPPRPEVIFEHDARINAIAFTPDGHHLLCAGGDGVLVVIDLESEKTRKHRIHLRYLHDIAISEDGQMLASVSGDLTVNMWAMHRWDTPAETLSGAKSPLRAVSVHAGPPRRVLAGSENGMLHLWSGEAAAICRVWPAHSNIIRSVAINRRGNRMLSGGDDQTVRLWTPSGDELRTFKGSICQARAVAFAPCGTHLASAHDDARIRFWDVALGQAIGRPLVGHRGRIWSLAFAMRGRILLSAGEDGALIAWREGRQQHEWRRCEHDYRIFSVAAQPEGAGATGDLAVTGGADATVRLWRITTGEHIKTLTDERQHHGRVRCVAFHPRGDLIASASEDRSILMWHNLGAGWTLTFPLVQHAAGVSAVVFHPDGRLIASGSEDGEILLWDLETRSVVSRSQAGSSRAVLSLAVTPDGRGLLAGGEDGRLSYFGIDGLVLRDQQCLHNDWIEDVAIHPSGRWFATASDDGIVLVAELEDWQRCQRLCEEPQYHGLDVSGLELFSEDQRETLLALGAITRHLGQRAEKQDKM